MTTLTTSARYTPEDLLHLDGDPLVELVGGQLVEKQTSLLAGDSATCVVYCLKKYLERAPIGKVVSEVTFQCFPDDPDLVRRPDVAFLTAEKVAAIPDEGHVPVAPDLAIEVISPGDRINAFEEKLADYRSAGVKLVWEVNPKFRYIRIHRPDRTTTFLEENDILTGESVLPGFSAQAKELLPLT